MRRIGKSERLKAVYARARHCTGESLPDATCAEKLQGRRQCIDEPGARRPASDQEDLVGYKGFLGLLPLPKKLFLLR